MPVNGRNLGCLRRYFILLSSYNVYTAATVGPSLAAATKWKGQASANLSTCILNPKISSRGTGEGRLGSQATCSISSWLKFPSSAIVTPCPATILPQQTRRLSDSGSRKHTPPDDGVVSTYGLYGDVQEINRRIQWFDVDTDELVELIADGDIQLFDVREPEELVETGHIPGAVNLPRMYIS